MKNYQSTTEGTWIELKRVKLTEEQKTLLISKDEADIDAKKELVEQIKAEINGEVEAEKANELNAFYQTKKPALKEEYSYELISADLFEKQEGIFEGILNCKVNGEHKQIRFSI